MHFIRMVQMRNRKIFSATVILLFFYLCIHLLSTSKQFNIYLQNYSNLQPRIYCFILTSPKYFNTRARAVNSTWAPRCDKYTFISEYSNDTKGLPIAPIANITPGYAHLTLKTTLAFHYVYENFINDFDWFVKADDDTYIFVDHLKSFLKEQNTLLPITFGFNFKVKIPNGYHSGGAGYVLSREAVKRFYKAHHKPNTTCKKNRGAEDVQIAKCLRTAGVYMGKSIDKYNRERFHPLSFTHHFMGRFPQWLKQYSENKLTNGIDCCSDSTISFHYINPEHQYLIDKMHYGFHR